jgi:hypothetical protein
MRSRLSNEKKPARLGIISAIAFLPPQSPRTKHPCLNIIPGPYFEGGLSSPPMNPSEPNHGESSRGITRRAAIKTGIKGIVAYSLAPQFLQAALSGPEAPSNRIALGPDRKWSHLREPLHRPHRARRLQDRGHVRCPAQQGEGHGVAGREGLRYLGKHSRPTSTTRNSFRGAT